MYNIQLLRNVSYQVRGQTHWEYVATYNTAFPSVWPFFAEDRILEDMELIFGLFVENFRSANGLDGGN